MPEDDKERILSKKRRGRINRKGDVERKRLRGGKSTILKAREVRRDTQRESRGVDGAGKV